MHGIALLFAGEHAEGAALVAAARRIASRTAASTATTRWSRPTSRRPALRGRRRRARAPARDGSSRAARAESAPGVLAVRAGAPRRARAGEGAGRWPAPRSTRRARLARETGQSADLGIALGARAGSPPRRATRPLPRRRRRGAGAGARPRTRRAARLRGARARPARPRLRPRRGRGARARAPGRAATTLEGLVRRRRPAASRPGPGRGAVPQRPHGATPRRRAIAYAEEAAARRPRVGARRGGALSRAGGPAAELDEPFDGRAPPPRRRPATRSRRRARDLLHGERLRREGRRVDGRGRLRAALDAFAALGAEPWVERAQRSCGRSGEVLRRRDPAAIDELTPQELQIALVVSEGVSNRRGRRPAVPEPEDRRVPPRPRLPQARPALARPSSPSCATTRRAACARRPRPRRERARRTALDRRPARAPGRTGAASRARGTARRPARAGRRRARRRHRRLHGRERARWRTRASPARSGCATR